MISRYKIHFEKSHRKKKAFLRDTICGTGEFLTWQGTFPIWGKNSGDFLYLQDRSLCTFLPMLVLSVPDLLVIPADVTERLIVALICIALLTKQTEHIFVSNFSQDF